MRANPGFHSSRSYLLALGMLAALGIGLLAGYYPVFDPSTQALYATNRDALDIVEGARQAEARGTGAWWTGNWIQPTSRFYRPLASLLMYAEYRLWGTDFQKYCVVSWLAHGAISALAFLFAFRLFRQGGERAAWLGGLLAVVLFNLRRGVSGPGWPPQYILDDFTFLSYRATYGDIPVPPPTEMRPLIPFRIVYGEMPYWPAQTDLFSLLFALASLLALDGWAARLIPGPRIPAGEGGQTSSPGDRVCPQGASLRAGYLALSLLCFLVAMLFKEMALTVALLAALLLGYRQRRLLWAAGPFLVLGALLLALRSLLVPGATIPARPEGRWIGFLAHYWLYQAASVGIWWPFPAAGGILALLYCVRRYRISLVWFVLGSLLWALFMAQVVGGIFAYLFLPIQAYYLLLATLLLGGLAVLLRSRSAIDWTLVGMLVAVHLPILQVKGPHYLYWPALFWSLLSAALVLSAWDWWRELGRSPSPAPVPATKT